MTDTTTIVTRMAPSPTGPFHVGGVRTALFNYLYARKHGGKFILRIEDTDKARSKKEYEENILDAFSWLGLEFDEFYRQSERTEIYKKHLQDLIDRDLAYVSQEVITDEMREEATKEGRTVHETVIRFRNPGKEISFDDQVIGTVSMNTSDLGDFVIAKDLETPLYHFVVVVDDSEMSVTDVIRGQDHLSNTPRQILIGEALGVPTPRFAHIPFILGSDGKRKLSKRDAATTVTAYRDQGFLPEALINFLALLGWNPGSDQELFTIDELIDAFTLDRVQKGGAQFNTEKLRSINKSYLDTLADEAYLQGAQPFMVRLSDLPNYSHDRLMNLLPTIRERTAVYSDISEDIERGEYVYYMMPTESLEYDPAALVWKKSSLEATQKHLEHVCTLLGDISDRDWTMENLQATLMPYAEQEGKGDVLWPTRYALTGKDRSPDPFTSLVILGKEASLERLERALTLLRK